MHRQFLGQKIIATGNLFLVKLASVEAIVRRHFMIIDHGSRIAHFVSVVQ